MNCLSNTCGEAAEHAKHDGVIISEKRLRQITIRVSQTGLDLRKQRLANPPPPCDDWKGKRIAVLLDGGRIQIRENHRARKPQNGGRHYDTAWREPKLFVIYEIDENGHKRKKSSSRCDGTIGTPDAITELLIAELKLHGAAQAEQVIFLSDGAPWIWNRLDDIAAKSGIAPEKVRKCLDFYHAVEHLTKMADAIPFASEKQRRKFLDEMKHSMKTLESKQFLDVLAKYRRKGNKTIRQEYQYFVNHALGLNYREMIELKLPIGSGAVESAIRRVVNLRLKGAGMFWLLENAEGFLHLRCQLKSGNWAQCFDEIMNNYSKIP